MEKEVILKRALIGGFNRKQVMNYIAYLYERNGEVKQEREKIADLNETLQALRRELTEKENTIDELNRAVAEAEDRTQLARSSAALMQQTVTYTDLYVENARVLAREISKKTADCIETSKEKINSLMDSVSEISDSVYDVYTSLEVLRGEYDDFGLLYDRPGESHAPEEDAAAPAASPEFTPDKVPDFSDVRVEDDFIPSDDEIVDFLNVMEEKYRSMLPPIS